MFQDLLPPLPDTLAKFSDWQSIFSAATGLLLIALLIIWWRQQTEHWFRIVVGTLLLALLFCIGSIYLFQVPPFHMGCPTALCTGWGGYPLPVASLEFDGSLSIAPLDFLINLLLLWLIWLGAGLLWTLFAIAFQWWKRSLRLRLGFVLFLVILPWALLPRILNPPQPTPTGDDLRLANNARRSAEFTYRITGLWVQRLAVEDLLPIESEVLLETPDQEGLAATKVCLRGYIYFYLPWRRYRIVLDTSGTTALSLAEVPLRGSCWAEDEAS